MYPILDFTNNRLKTTKQRLKYKLWRKAVFRLNRRRSTKRRFQWICRRCYKIKKSTQAFHAHHIKSWNKFPKSRYSVKNGIVLCIKCHIGFHKKYKFKALEKPELLEEWLNDVKRFTEKKEEKNKKHSL